jgi:hypothetical protein
LQSLARLMECEFPCFFVPNSSKIDDGFGLERRLFYRLQRMFLVLFFPGSFVSGRTFRHPKMPERGIGL